MVLSEELFRLTGVGAVQTDMETGRFLRANPTFCKMVGYTEEELTGMTNAQLTHPEDRERDSERFAALQTGELTEDQAVTRVLHKDGREVWLELSITLMGEGEQAVNLTVVNDVTGRKRTEERQAYLLKLSDALRPLVDPLEVQREASRILRQQLGADRVAYAELDTDEDTARLLTEDRADHLAPFTGAVYAWSDFDPAGHAEAKQGRSVSRADVQVADDLTPEQKANFAAVSCRALINTPLQKSGRLVAFIAVHWEQPHDATPADVALVEETAERTWAAVERARAEASLAEFNETLEQQVKARTQELERSNTRFSQAFTLAPFPALISTLGTNETFLEVNAAFLAFTRYRKEDIIGHTAFDLKMWSSKDDQKKLAQAQKDGQGFKELALQLKDGEGNLLDVLLSAEVIRIDGHEGYLKMFYDVTKQKRTDEEMALAVSSLFAEASWFSQEFVARLNHIRSGRRIEDYQPLELSRREREVLLMVARGWTNKRISEELGLKQQTIRNYLANIFEKIGVHSRTEAAVWARERGLIA